MSSRKKKGYANAISMTECNMCHSELSDPRRIDCGHVFCLRCLGEHVIYSPFCPTCNRLMKPNLEKVENYPVAIEIVQLLKSLQKVASSQQLAEESSGADDYEQGDGYESIDIEPDQGTSKIAQAQPKSIKSNEVCDLHGYRLVSVCTTCDDEPICEKCSIHSTHNRIQISEHNGDLERLLEKQRADLLQREKDNAAQEESLQEMIEKQVDQKETIRDEIEEIAEEMFSQIHTKKEAMLKPIEEKSEEYVKRLTERQEHIKDRISEISHISNMIGKLSNDDTTIFSRKAKRLIKQANIALQTENKPIPSYQNIEFTRNETVLKELLQLQLGDVNIDEVSIAEDEEGKASDFIDDEEVGYDDYPYFNIQHSSVSPEPEPTQIPTRIPLPAWLDIPPPLPNSPRSPRAATDEEHIYEDLYTADSKSLREQIQDTKPAKQKEDHHFNPPPLSPFSGTFKKSVSMAIDSHSFPQKLIHRVFLPFRPSGFTVVRGSQENYFAFVYDTNTVTMFRQNGDMYRTLTDVVQPFDVASQQRGESLTPLYISDKGKRTGDGCVRVFTPEGQFQKVLVGRLKKPQGISISRVGLVYVCDEANILVFCQKTGKKKRVISAIGKDPIFVNPLYVMVSATGKVLVSDVGTRELKIHDESRKYTDKFKPDEDKGELYTSFTPGMCAEDSSSNYYVIDSERNMLYILRGAGRSEKLALPPKPLGHDGIPTAVTFSSDTGNIIVF